METVIETTLETAIQVLGVMPIMCIRCRLNVVGAQNVTMCLVRELMNAYQEHVAEI